MAHKFIYLPLLLVAQLWLVACAQTPIDDSLYVRASLKLADGSLISTVAADDYSPIIVRLSNGYLALVFGSTRACSVSCTNHNIFIASSIAPYQNDGVLPAFNEPQPVTANASPLNTVAAYRLAVSASGNNITVYAQTPGGLISTTGSVNPVSAAPINVGAMLNSITEYNCYNHRMLGLDAAGLMIATNLAGTLVFRFNQNMIGGGSCGSIANPAMAESLHLSVMRQASTGISDAYLGSEIGGGFRAHSATSSSKPMADLRLGLASKGLFATAISVFQAATAAGDLLTFSAAPGIGQKSDLYVMKYPTPQVLWSSYVAFGQQPQP
jgi:hypothetical protein